jgi:ELWxxDGT repeat protein
MLRRRHGNAAAPTRGISMSNLLSWALTPAAWLKCCAAAAFLVASGAAAVEVGPLSLELVKDFNTDPQAQGSGAQSFYSLGDRVYFSADTPETGAEIFVTDGTPGGARLFHDFMPGPASSGAFVLGHAGDHLIVAGRKDLNVRIWSLDLRTQTSAVLKEYSETNYSGPIAYRGESTATHSYFSVVHDNSFWTTDGTPGGTHRLYPSGNAGWLRDSAKLCALPNGTLVMAATATALEQSLQLSDGSGSPPIELASRSSFGANAEFVTRSDHYCYFLQPGWRLWRSDGTVAGTSIVAQGGGVPAGLAALGDTPFVVDRAADQLRLWRAGDMQLLGSWPAPFPVKTRLRAIGGRLAFVGPSAQATASDLVYGVFLSDGTAAGTRRVFPAQPGQVLRHETELLDIGAKTMFVADFKNYRLDPVSGIVVQFGNNSAISGFHFFEETIVKLGDAVVGSGYDQHGHELWRSNATPEGSYRLDDVWAATRSGLGTDGEPVPAIGNVLYFSHVSATPASGGSAASTIWRTDGTTAGTWGLPLAEYDGRQAYRMLRAGDGLVFQTRGTQASESNFYRVDAVLGDATLLWNNSNYPEIVPLGQAGAVFGCDLAGNPDSLCAYRDGEPAAGVIWPQFGGNFRSLGSVGNVAMFFGDHSNNEPRRGLWRSDGTAPGTFRISADIAVSGSGFVSGHPFNGRLYFSACAYGNLNDCGLYVSDATLAGTMRVAANPQLVMASARVGGRLVLLNNAEVYSTDGTAAGTVPLYPYTPGDTVHGLADAGGYVHFVVDGFTQSRYFVSDGTPAGTRAVDLPLEQRPHHTLGALDDERVLFACLSDAMGLETCVIGADGSDARLLRDLFPGPRHSNPYFLGRTGDAAYLIADDGRHGLELWRVVRLGDALFAARFE